MLGRLSDRLSRAATAFKIVRNPSRAPLYGALRRPGGPVSIDKTSRGLPVAPTSMLWRREAMDLKHLDEKA
jgi:hypothetical protein